MAEHSTLILSDIREEAKRLAEAAVSLGLSARLIGGLAIWLRCPSVREGPFARSYDDMDFAISAAAGTKFKALLMTQGYLPDQFFNGLHGATRLYFGEPAGRWSIDVVIDELAMSHKLDLRGRLDGPAPTITLADLLLTKLQVWEINRKDLGDTVCLLADHALSEDDADAEESASLGCARCSARTGASATPSYATRRRSASCGRGNRCRRRRTTSPPRSLRCSERSRTRRSRGHGGCAAASVNGSAGTRHPRRSSTDGGGRH